METVQVYKKRDGKYYLIVGEKAIEIKSYAAKTCEDGTMETIIVMEGIPVNVLLQAETTSNYLYAPQPRQ